MKAVFFKSTIPIEIHRLDENGKIVIESVTRHMEQGEVVEVLEYSESSMMILDGGAIWWNPDKKYFNLVGVGTGPVEKCCG